MFVLAGVVAVFVGGYFFMTKSAPVDSMATAPEAVTSQPVVPIVSQPIAPVPATPVAASKVKEFTMTAYYDDKGAWYSLKEMTVKKGDTVRVTITNTKGMHNFNIDELGVKSDLPLNTPVIVEFTAEKAGDFVYYCAMPGHRAKGQWGTLHVTQ
jgi:nitrite reductase (NO-forming)